MRSTLFLLAGLLPSSCANTRPPPQQQQLAQAIAAPDRQEPPVALSNTTRELLRTRMASHTSDMADLMSAIMILDYPRIAERSAAIAADVNLARPLSDDATDLSAAIPASFFDYQDLLRERAKTLADAAEHRSAIRVADAYGRVSETCVRCHAVYRGNH